MEDKEQNYASLYGLENIITLGNKYLDSGNIIDGCSSRPGAVKQSNTQCVFTL